MPGEVASPGTASTVLGFVGKVTAPVTKAIDGLNLAIGKATYAFVLMLPKFPAARLFVDLVFQFGHSHPHPPTFGVPIPSMGPILASGAQSVLINGLPAARCGDLGLSAWCGGYVPIFEVMTGSSHVFMGGARAARMLTDPTFHCLPDPFAGMGKVAKAQKLLSVGEKIGLGAAVVMSGLGKLASGEAGDAEVDALEQRAQAAADAAADAEASGTEAEMLAMVASLAANDAAQTAAAKAVEASVATAQMAADIAAAAMGILMGKDPGVGFPFGFIMTGSPNVLVGGFPMPGWMTILRGLLKMLQPVLRRVQMKLPAGKLKKALCFLTGDPVDVASGRVVTSAIDFEFPGRIPIAFERSYDSASIDYEGPLGWGWTHSFDHHLWYDRRQRAMIWRDFEGRVVGFDQLAVGDSVYHPFEKVWLNRTGEAEYIITGQESQLRYRFGVANAQLVGQSEETALRLVEIKDRNNNLVSLEYSGGRLSAIDDGVGLRLLLSYEQMTDGRIRLKEVRRAIAREQSAMLVRYDYNAEGELEAVTDRTQVPFRYYYDRHLMVRRMTRNGLSFYFEYQGEGREARCIHTWGDGGIYERWITYQPRARATIVRDSLEGETVYHYNELDQVTRIRNPEGGIRKYEYGSVGELLAEEDELGRKRTYSYDEFYSRTGVVQEDGTKKRLQYNAASQPMLLEDEIGAQWRREYDERNNPIVTIDPLGGRRKLTYNKRGDILELVDATANVTRVECDEAGLVKTITYPTGARVIGIYDGDRHLVERRDEPSGLCRKYYYDRTGRLERVKHTDTRGESTGQTRYEYDPEGNITRYIDALGNSTQYRYKGFNKLYERVDALGYSRRLEYDTEERLVSIENEREELYGINYDLAGRAIKETEFDGSQRVYEYNAAGHLICKRDAAGGETKYNRDPLGRVVTRLRPDHVSIDYEYDPRGKLLSTQTPTAVIRLSYDVIGRLIRENQNGNIIEYEYDAEGRRLKRSRTSAGSIAPPSSVEYEYDPGGALVGIRAAGQQVNFVLDKAGRMGRRELSNGLTESYQYDHTGRVAVQNITRQATEGPLLRRAYQWDAVGNLVEIRDSLRGTRKFTYDAVERLTRVTRIVGDPGSVEGRHSSFDGSRNFTDIPLDRRLWAGSDVQGMTTGSEKEVDDFGYDGSGNLVELKSKAVGQLSFSYDRGLRLRACDGTNFRYDPVGNRIERSEAERTIRYSYDADNQLTSVSGTAAGGLEFIYDGFGRRIEKQGQHESTSFLWDGDVLLLEERTSDTQPDQRTAVEYVYEPDTFIPVLMIKYCATGVSVEDIHTDDLGTPQEVSDSSGEFVWRGEYNEYGALAYKSSETWQPLRFQGQYEDSETGIYYNRFRYYDPGTGRYITKDPMGLFGGINPYLYSGNPRNNVDPLGLIIVYRNLRPDEDPLTGLVAKNPGREMTPAGHIMNGSRPTFRGSQFISTTTKPEVAERWRQEGQVTVKIDTDLVEADALGNLRIVDVSTSEKAAEAGLRGRPYANAVSSGEVLIEGHVPPEAITGC